MRVVLGTDGSEGAQWAGALVMALPFSPPLDVTVVSAVDVPQPAFTSLTPVARRAYGQALATMRREAEDVSLKAIEALADSLEGRANLATKLVQGSPGPALVQAALHADLLAVGSRGIGPVKELLLGSVSQQVVRCAPCSVLIARQPVETLRGILVAVDGSVHAGAAIQFVRGLLLPQGVTVHLCSVAEEPIFGPGKTGRTPEAVEAALRTIAEIGAMAAKHVLQESQHQLAAAGCRIVTRLRSGHPVDHLLAELRAVRPDLVILGAKGRTSPKTASLGSAAQMVLKYAACSVLVARP
jgi:nucleotide-binding universal stress UspA family protein